MSDEQSDREFDAELRKVHLPHGLIARLKTVTQPTDDEIDSALLGLTVPSSLADRLKAALEDEFFDDSLRTVDVPLDLLARLRVIPERRRESSVRRFVLAASLLLIMTGSFFGALGGLLASIRPLADQATSLAVIQIGPTQLVAAPPEFVRFSMERTTDMFSQATTPVVWKGGPLQVDLVRLDETITPGPAGQLIREVEDGLQLGSDVLLMRWDAYASPQQAAQGLPELDYIERRSNAGVDLPLVDGYDRAFLHRSSTHPPVFVAASERLETIRVPLSTSVASFRRSEELIELGRLPDQQEVRPEEFLAAVNYGYASRDDEEVSVTLLAGPAPFSVQNSSLIQVGVKAAQQVGTLPTHLAIVIDVSQSMLQQDRLGTVREALRTMFNHLGPGDSVSLIAVNHEVVHQIDFATVEDRELLDAWLKSLRAGGGDRPVVGIQSAISLAFEAQRDGQILRQLAFVTDGSIKLAVDERAQLDHLLADAKGHAMRATLLQIVDTTQDQSRDESGVAFENVSSEELPWTLAELVTGVSSMVARQPRVEVTFNPKAVRAYRLVGHGPTSLTGLNDTVWVSDLQSGQEATLLFEVWMNESYEDEVVAATVHWVAREVEHEQQSRRASLSRYDIATRLLEAPTPLRMAGIAAEIGERLKGVGTFELQSNWRFRSWKKSAGWQEVINAASELGSTIDVSEDFLRLVELARKLEALRRPAPQATTL